MKKRGMMALVMALECVLLGGDMLAANEAPPTFTRKPVVTRQGDKIRVSFSVSRETDVAVFVEDEKGKIVRHLVAGVLGKNPPPPLQAGSLEQTLEWDGKADYEKPASGGSFKFRVSLGLGARYDKVLISDPNSLGSVNSLAVGPDGTLYVVMSCGGAGPVWAGQQMVAFNRDGTYARMLMPFPSNLKTEQVKGFDVLEVNGRPIPLLHDLDKRSFYPAFGGRKAGMAVTADGKILRMVNFNLGIMDTQGGAPCGAYAGPKLLPLQRGHFNSLPFVAITTDGRYAMITGIGDRQPDKKPEDLKFSAVYRVKIPERGQAEPFFGDPAKAGADETHLGGAPRGLASDGKGHLLIADPANNRVVVVGEADGKFAGAFPVQNPDQVAVDPGTGAVYVSRLSGHNVELAKFSGWKDAKETAKLALPLSGNPEFPWVVALDSGAKPPVLWAGGDAGDLLRIEDLGDKFGAPKGINRGDIGNASFVDISVDRVRKEIYSRISLGPYTWFRYAEETDKLGKVTPGPYPGAAGSQLVVAPDGNLYSPAYSMNLLRFDSTGKPLPWASPQEIPGGGKMDKSLNNSAYAPTSMTFLTHTLGIRHDGQIFVFDPGKPGGRPAKMLVQYDPSGKRIGGPVIWKVSDTAVGPKFDPQGNIYIAEQVKPLGQPHPPEFSNFVGPIEVSKSYLEGLKDQIPSMYGSILKFSPKGGMVHFGGDNPFEGEPKLDPALKSVDAICYASHRLHPTKVTGAQWMHMGVSHVDLVACNCENTRFDVDEFGRVFYPDLGLFRVGVLDTNGNLIVHFGGYGNAECCGPESKVIDPATGKLRPRQPGDPADLKSPFAEPEIAFSWLIGVGATDRYAYMGDSLNRRLLRAKLVYAAEEYAAVPQ